MWRVAPGARWVGVAIWLPLVLIGAGVAVNRADWSFPVTWIGAFGLAAWQLALAGTSLAWDASTLEYRSLWRRRAVPFAEIAEASFGAASRRSAPMMLVLVPRGAAVGCAPLRINIKPFGPAALRALAQTLESHGIPLQAASR